MYRPKRKGKFGTDIERRNTFTAHNTVTLIIPKWIDSHLTMLANKVRIEKSEIISWILFKYIVIDNGDINEYVIPAAEPKTIIGDIIALEMLDFIGKYEQRGISVTKFYTLMGSYNCKEPRVWAQAWTSVIESGQVEFIERNRWPFGTSETRVRLKKRREFL